MLDTAAIRLESSGTVVCVALVAVAAVAVLVAGWNRWSRPGPGRALSLLVAVAAVVGTGGLLANRVGGFYPTVGSLTADGPERGSLPVGRVPVRAGHGHLMTVRAGDGLPDVEVYLPAAYADPALAGALFPTVLWTGDGPLSGSALPDRVDAAIADQLLPPAVVVDVGSGARERTVRAIAGTQLRLRPERGARAVAGPAEGGGCPLDIALRTPGDYATAAGHACRAVPHDPRPTQLLATALADRPVDVASAHRIRDAATPSVPVGTEIFPAGTDPGAVLDAELQWIGSRLPGPIADVGGRRGPT